jgi:hypothetical protein
MVPIVSVQNRCIISTSIIEKRDVLVVYICCTYIVALFFSGNLLLHYSF